MTMPMSSPGLSFGLTVVRRIHRGELIAVAVIGILLGAIALIWPDATLLTVAIIFGSYLIVSGIFRITAAFVAERLSTGLRWLTGIMGLLVIVAGIICLANPFQSLVVLAFVIGIGWIAEGIVDLMAGVQGTVTPRWLAFVSGTVSILAGITVFVLPVLAVAAFVTIAAVLLIAVSITTLLTLPRSHTTAARTA
jgi:uncharacterized membrane protein HdeD (DUF308 family)